MHKMMVVDDEIAIATQLEELLTSMGYEVVGLASSGKSAVEMAKNLKPDLVLMDIVMPGELDGIAAAGQIMDELGASIIFVTAYADEEIINRAKNLQPIAYILKPFREVQIKAAVEIALHKIDLERQLRTSEERYRQMVENSPNPIFSVDTHGTIQIWNESCERAFQYGKEMVGRKYNELLSQSMDRSIIEGQLNQVLEGGSIENAEIIYQCKDGSEKTMISRIYPLYDYQNEVKGSVFANTDITERKRSEEEIESQNRLMSTLLDNLKVGVFMVEAPTGKPLLANKHAKELLGRGIMNDADKTTLAEVYNAYKLGTDEFYPEDQMPIVRGMYGESHYVDDMVVVHPDGTRVLLEIFGSPVKDRDGNVVASLVSFRDVTEQKHAKEALQQSEQRYRSLVENTLDGYFICEIPSGRFIFLNQRICDLSGYTMQEGLNLTIWDVVDPEEHKLIRERIQARIEGKESSFASNTYRAIRKDGSKFQAEVSTSLITYQGKPVMQGVLRDVTEAQMLQMQLLQAQKMESLGTLAGGIAHNINNTLMGIQGRASLMMLDKDPSHPDLEHLKGIEEYVKNAAELTKDLLGFARGGKYEVSPTNLNDLVKHENRMFGQTKKEIRVHGKYEKNPWAVEVDREQIRQALLNLYVNAWQAMPGGGDLYVDTENVTIDENYVKPFEIKAGRYIKISVTDTGVGMDEATREKIFDPFFSTQEMGRGTGLGLASVYGIVKNHGGFINVYSEMGKGTTFNIYLPASEKEVVEEKKPSREVVTGEGTILLVDDEQMIIDVGKQLLEKLGYRVISAKNGTEAITLYEKSRSDIDMVILDMIMPGMGGGDTYDRLKEIDPEVKVLLSSGYSINGQAQEILDRGCNGFIQKPFSMKDLSHKIRKNLSNQ